MSARARAMVAVANRRWWPALIGLAVAGMLSVPVAAQQFSRESEIGELRLGQRVQVDDGSCPAGQILEISGSTLTAAGVTRVRKCVARKGTKKQ